MGKVNNLVGRKFGRLEPFERVRKDRKTLYHCKCDCGKTCWAAYANLYMGNTRSCGCLRDEARHRRKQPDDVIRLNQIVRYYKRNAKLRGVAWDISKEFFRLMITAPCEYCGWNDDWVGVDRRDNSKGYEYGNCAPCCRWCNWGKNERTMEEFGDWVRRLYVRFCNVR